MSWLKVCYCTAHKPALIRLERDVGLGRYQGFSLSLFSLYVHVINLCTCKHVCIYIYIYIHMCVVCRFYVHTCLLYRNALIPYEPTHTCTYMYRQLHRHTDTHTHMYIYIYMYTCVCIYAYICIMYIQVYIQTCYDLHM